MSHSLILCFFILFRRVDLCNKCSNKHFFNLEKRNILLVLHKEISELNDQMNIDMVVKML